MIPQDTLNIIEQEAKVLNIFHAISPAHEYWRRGFIAGAKRGYELRQPEIDELKKANLHYRTLLQICKNKLLPPQTK